jgi:two-component system OmpR family sensor kinase
VVLGDRERLRRIVDNLLSNVRAHTPATAPASVKVSVSVGTAHLVVEDSGPGIAADDLNRVFERFFRADPSRARASGGVGLGLSIVAAVAAAHDGSASVRSANGGAIFEIRIPLAK